MLQGYLTYLTGGLMIALGLAGLATGLIENTEAMAFVLNGMGLLGLRRALPTQ